MQYHHRMVQFVFEGRNYVGPVREMLSGRCSHKRRVLDLGTGGGLWFVVRELLGACDGELMEHRAVEMADEFPDVAVIGVDIVPIQPL